MWWWLRPILVFSLSLDQAEQLVLTQSRRIKIINSLFFSPDLIKKYIAFVPFCLGSVFLSPCDLVCNSYHNNINVNRIFWAWLAGLGATFNKKLWERQKIGLPWFSVYRYYRSLIMDTTSPSFPCIQGTKSLTPNVANVLITPLEKSFSVFMNLWIKVFGTKSVTYNAYILLTIWPPLPCR